MRNGIIWVATAVAALSPASYAADEIAWGTPFDGMRLGITLDRSLPEPSFRVLLQNTTDAPCDVRIADRTGVGDIQSVMIFGFERNGTRQVMLDKRAPFVVSGVLTPIIVRIVPGGTHEILFPLNKLVYGAMISGELVQVQVPVDRGWSFEAVSTETSRLDTLRSGQIQTTKQ
jgi:hypothetical protein